jgi:ectoine hydroxylase-related dioxygenase (phytanoyl-CoA dioxygenase family)
MKRIQNVRESSPKLDYIDEIERHGFSVIQEAIDLEAVGPLLEEIERITANEFASERAGKVFAIRDLLNILPSTRKLANGSLLRSIVEPVLGKRAKVVRAVYFDKHEAANWKVAWHQDLTIAVRQQLNVTGYGPWSIKAGIPHVQPPVSVLQNMLTLRLHLDHTDEANGALRVLPGSHKHGRLNAQDIESCQERDEIVTVKVTKGGALLMRPLLLHASSSAKHPRHRRVLHFEYSSSDLPHGLEWFDG